MNQDNYNTDRWNKGLTVLETICDRLFVQQAFGWDAEAGGCRNHAYRGDPMDGMEVRCAVGCLMPLEEAKANPSGTVDNLPDELVGAIHDGLEGPRYSDISWESRVAFRGLLRAMQEYHDDMALQSAKQDEFLHLAGLLLNIKRTVRFLRNEWLVYTVEGDFRADLKHGIPGTQHHRIDAILNSFLAYAEKR